MKKESSNKIIISFIVPVFCATYDTSSLSNISEQIICSSNIYNERENLQIIRSFHGLLDFEGCKIFWVKKVTQKLPKAWSLSARGPTDTWDWAKSLMMFVSEILVAIDFSFKKFSDLFYCWVLSLLGVKTSLRVVTLTIFSQKKFLSNFSDFTWKGSLWLSLRLTTSLLIRRVCDIISFTSHCFVGRLNATAIFWPLFSEAFIIYSESIFVQ